MEATGLISVMPQACRTGTPYFVSKVFTTARGQAEPPIATRVRLERRVLVASICWRSANHTVGTAAEKVTRSDSRSSWIDGPSSFGPGMTKPAPTIGAAKASDQLLAWNRGTTGSTVSRADSPKASGVTVIIACSTLERCE